ncbi:MAG TPA: MFS transporter, partial [Ureibacillus sp.]|nr:MFS transporter [Ureibacillus sp.]
SALLAFGFGTYMSSAQAIAAKVAPPKNIGLAISTFYIGLDFGIGIGPFLLGFVIPLVGFRTLYALLGILVLILLGAYFMLHGSKVKQLYSN